MPWSGVVEPEDKVDYGRAYRRQDLGEVCSSCRTTSERRPFSRRARKLTTHGGVEPHGREAQQIAGPCRKGRAREIDEEDADAYDERFKVHVGRVFLDMNW